MAMIVYDDVLKSGIIRVKKSSSSVIDLGLWKTYDVSLRKSSSVGPIRIQLNNYKISKKKVEKNGIDPSFQQQQDGLNKTDISLVGVYRITITPPVKMPNSFFLTFINSSTKVYLAFDSIEEMMGWQQSIEINLPSPVTRGVDLLNDANYQADDIDIFNAFLLCNPLLSFYGECQLKCIQSCLFVCHPDDSTQIFLSWPLTSLKRFTWDKEKFIMQTGRSCKTGEGIFVFNTYMGKQIVEKIKLESSRTILESPSLTSSLSSSSSSVSPSSSRFLQPLPPIPPRNLNTPAVPSSRS